MINETSQVMVHLEDLLLSFNNYKVPNTLMPIIDESFNLTADVDNIADENRLIASIASLILNLDDDYNEIGTFNKSIILKIINNIDNLINDQINIIIHDDKFQHLESMWRSLSELITSTKSDDNVIIDVLDVAKDEIFEDFECNAIDITGSALFKKTYIAEYDQYGGKPYSTILGLYEFDNTNDDLFWLQSIAKLANANHSPFIASISHKFFGCNNIKELADLKNLDIVMNHPRYAQWQTFRSTAESAYIGLTLPRYVLRLPYHPNNNAAKYNFNHFAEDVCSNDDPFLWGLSGILFVKNMLNAYRQTGWCQAIRGPKGGGLVTGLPLYVFNVLGYDEVKIPVEFAIPDYREYEFARNGFMPLVYQKGSNNACFFSCQSVKKFEAYLDQYDNINAQMITNLAYTLSITRIAHYVKRIMRDNIGSSADMEYVQKVLNEWITSYVTEISNPDSMSLAMFPFKQAAVKVQRRAGEIGWYDCTIRVLPHAQFEGMDVELRLDARLEAVN